MKRSVLLTLVAVATLWVAPSARASDGLSIQAAKTIQLAGSWSDRHDLQDYRKQEELRERGYYDRNNDDDYYYNDDYYDTHRDLRDRRRELRREIRRNRDDARRLRDDLRDIFR